MVRLRPHLRFSLRTLFVLVTVVCIPLGWLGYQLNWIRLRREAIAIGRVVDFGDSAQPDSPGLLWLFGEHGYAHLFAVGNRPPSDEWTVPDEAELTRLKKLFPEATVSGWIR